MLTLSGLTYDEACLRLEENGYERFAEGDWAYAYLSPDARRVIRITPYDPAYLLFVYTCWTCPHANLPLHFALIRLAGPGYAVEMPRYVAGDVTLREGFVNALKAAMDAQESSSELVARGSERVKLCATPKQAITRGSSAPQRAFRNPGYIPPRVAAPVGSVTRREQPRTAQRNFYPRQVGYTRNPFCSIGRT